MFERYTEGARRSIFFGRYEASQLGSPYIETEHILLGLLREDKALFKRLLPKVEYEAVEQEVAAYTIAEKGKKLAPSVDLPLTNESKRALAYAAEEAERLAHRHIGTEHLLLGLLREEKNFAKELLRKRGADLPELRLEVSKLPAPWSAKNVPVPAPGLRHSIAETMEIHGVRWNVDFVHDLIKRCRRHNWHWRKSPLKARDIVVAHEGGSFSFDLELARDRAKFQLVEKGWKKDHCIICLWELIESADDPARGIGYTNGRDWLCSECYEKFIAGDFFAPAHSEIT